MKSLGIILAGGQSTRMKRDKANLDWHGLTLLEFQYQKLVRILGQGNVWVSGDRSGYPKILDIRSGRGPVEAIYSTMKFFSNNPDICFDESNDSILFLPVDMPFLDDETLSRMLLEGKSISDKFDGLCCAGFEMPLLLKCSDKVMSHLQDMNKDDRKCISAKRRSAYSVQQLLRCLRVGSLDGVDSQAFQNLNTQEDLNAALC